MRDSDCVRFLKWALPELNMRWPGFRKVRRQVCRRIARRIGGLGLPDTDAYCDYLRAHDKEWKVLDGLCRVTISRFYRDRGVFRCLAAEVLPSLATEMLARGDTILRCWSIGCASGEEPYTLSLLWGLALKRVFPQIDLQITATDIDSGLLKRARHGCYSASSLKELPAAWRIMAFYEEGGEFCLLREYRCGVRFVQQDIRITEPGGGFHLILCRNLVFTYFETGLQEAVLKRIFKRLHRGGALVVGSHESLPGGVSGFVPWFLKHGVYRKEEVSK